MPLIEKHMDLLTPENIDPLLQDQSACCVSLFMPVHQRGKEAQQDRVRLKNLLRSAETLLQEHCPRASDVLDITAPAKSLIDDSVFWAHQSDGLAVFLGPESAYVFRLPLEFQTLVECGRHYYVRPLIPMLTNAGRYYVLVLSQGEVKLLRCSRFEVSEVALHPTLRNMDEFLNTFEFEGILKRRPASSPGSGALATGHGMASDEVGMKERTAGYLRHLDTAVREVLNDERAPLVLAGVDFVRAHYREGSHYPLLMEEGIDGNFEQKSPEDIARRAWAIVQPVLEQERRRDLERMQQLIGSSDRRATPSIGAIVTAAWSRMIDVLFVPWDERYWGTFDASTMEVEVHEEPLKGDQDLLNLASIWTLRGGGRVYGCTAEELPDRAPVAAITW